MPARPRRVSVEFLGEDRTLSKSAQGADRKLSRLGSTLGAVGKTAAIGLAGGVVAAGAGLAALTVAATDDAAAQAKLEKTLKNAAKATDQQVQAVEDYITKTGLATGVTDDEMRPAFEHLARATGDVSKAQGLMNLALDVSAGTGKDLETVSLALARAQKGQTGGLGRLGIATKDAEGKTKSFAQITADLTRLFGGQAQTKANTFRGRIERLKLVAAETGETIGAKLLPISERLAGWFLDKGIPAIDAAVTAFEDFATDAVAAIRPVAGGLAAEAKQWAGKVSGWIDSIDFAGWVTRFRDGFRTGVDTGDWGPLGRSLADALIEAIQGVKDLAQKVGNVILDTLKKVDWVDVGEKAVAFAVPFALGFVQGMVDAMISTAFDHPLDTALFVLALLPFGKIAGQIAKLLARVPFLRVFAPLLRGLHSVTEPINGAIGQLVSFIARKFMEGFRRVFPRVGESWGKQLALLPLRLQVLAIDIYAKALSMVGSLARGIARGFGWVIARIGQLVGLLLKPFAKAGTWLVGKGVAVVSGIRSGITSGARAIGMFIWTHVIKPVTAPFVNAATWLVTRGSSVVTGLRTGIVNAIRGVSLWMWKHVAVPVLSPFETAVTWLQTRGMNIITGLKSGIVSAMRGIGGWVKGQIVDPIVKAVKDWFGIKSPSTVMAGIGGNLISGLMRGMGPDRGKAIAKKVFGGMPDALRAVVRKGLVSVAGLPQQALSALGSMGPIEVTTGGILGGLWKRQLWRGELFNGRTIKMIEAAERIWGGRYPITQGGWESPSSYSGTTHTGGGVFDAVLRPVPWAAVEALRRAGFAAWDRTGKGRWAPHIHAVAIGDPTASASARGQVRDYLAGGDGLGRGSNARGFDRGGWLLPGQTAINGTRRPEPIFNSPGQLQRFMTGPGAMAPVVINVTVNGAVDPIGTAKQVQKVLLTLKRTNGGQALGLT